MENEKWKIKNEKKHSQFSVFNPQLPKKFSIKLTFYFVVIFALFTAGIIIFERSREKKFRTEALKERLDAYAEVVENGYLIESGKLKMENEDSEQEFSTFNFQFSTLPDNLRITLIDRAGNVVYDNAVEGTLPENHTTRPEIALAKTKGKGSDIRTSATNSRKYLYYAKRADNYFIRVALPYDIQVQKFLQSDNLFLFYIVLLFIVTLVIIHFVANRFGTSIQKLKEFALSGENQPDNLSVEFPDDELGEIGRKIRDNYEQIRKKRQEVILEREKLLQHVYSSGEGLCFFSQDKKVEFYNGLFIQYLNTITEDSTSEPKSIFTDIAFKNTMNFLSAVNENESYYETQIGKQGKFFNVRVNLFEDRSFEIIINDITRQEKTRLLKQEMTSNIAHELRTPVTSIRGYLEIALEQSLDKEKMLNFLTKAHEQTIVLTELIQDMSLITKMEEAPSFFVQEEIGIELLLDSLKEDLNELLTEKNIHFTWKNIENIVVPGNRNLLYSIFRNLTDNAIRYAGTNISVIVNKYNEDNNFYYFSYSDTGAGISNEQHLNRLFERFYRVNEGRTRDTGGSGLGLSIVKNAVLFHKGTITVKNRTGGGLEFLFTLGKR
ncbi:two-component sensor histidine kinase [Paludibacter sp. 221]|uniref:sensor histidine kinase n=1 Tax=Paludibacter sp. 221 TaxID=2302939 RepID=UPI0013D555A2|nr:ATP-binding protein [Paludibacter sp. 221]NDV46294.1 two-component sensor histidine kinase [Paludibacter sp. 221]